MHLSQWQYWWWFWFSLFWTVYFFIIIRIINKKTFAFNPTLNTSIRGHGKWGDFLVALIPLSWCGNILVNSNFILRMIEWQNESSLFTIRVQGKQWYWVYKYDASAANNIYLAPKNIGRGRWLVSTKLDTYNADNYYQALHIGTQLEYKHLYYKHLSDESISTKFLNKSDMHSVTEGINTFKTKYNKKLSLSNKIAVQKLQELYKRKIVLKSLNITLKETLNKKKSINFFFEKLFSKFKKKKKLYSTIISTNDLFFKKLEKVDSLKKLSFILKKRQLNLSKIKYLITEWQYSNFPNVIKTPKFKNIVNNLNKDNISPVYYDFSQIDDLSNFAANVAQQDSTKPLIINKVPLNKHLKGVIKNSSSFSKKLVFFKKILNYYMGDKISYNNIFIKNKKKLTQKIFYISKLKSYKSARLNKFFNNNKFINLKKKYINNLKIKKFKPTFIKGLTKPVYINKVDKIYRTKYTPQRVYVNKLLNQNFKQFNNFGYLKFNYISLKTKKIINKIINKNNNLKSYNNESNKDHNSLSNIYSVLRIINGIKQREQIIYRDISLKIKLLFSKFKDFNIIRGRKKKLLKRFTSLINNFKFRVDSFVLNTKPILFTTIFVNNDLITEKVEDNELFWGFRQKKYKRFKNFKFLDRVYYDKKTLEPKKKDLNLKMLKTLKKSTIKGMINEDLLYSNEDVSDYQNSIKYNRHRSELVPVNLARRLLRTKRTLVLPAHVNITLVSSSYDVVHSWFIPGLGLKIDCVPGRSTHHSFYIDNIGFYYGQCAEICGRFHHHMPIRLCALSFDHFLVWWHKKGLKRLHRLNLITNKKYKKTSIINPITGSTIN